MDVRLKADADAIPLSGSLFFSAAVETAVEAALALAVEARATADAAVTLSGLSSSYSSVDADADKLLKSGARIQPVN